MLVVDAILGVTVGQRIEILSLAMFIGASDAQRERVQTRPCLPFPSVCYAVSLTLLSSLPKAHRNQHVQAYVRREIASKTERL